MAHHYLNFIDKAKWVLCVLFLLGGTSSAYAQGNVPDDVEYNALMELYRTTNGDNWTDGFIGSGYPTEWGSVADPNDISFHDFEQWPGVWVFNDDVYWIDLSNNNLDGELPPELNLLTALQGFVAQNNQLVGALPDLRQCTQLETLDLANNALNDALNDLVRYAPVSLVHLNLAYNGLQGTLSPGLAQFIHLHNLDLSHNELSDGFTDVFFERNYEGDYGLWHPLLDAIQNLGIFSNEEIELLTSELEAEQFSSPLWATGLWAVWEQGGMGEDELQFLIRQQNALGIQGLFELRYLDLSYNQFAESMPSQLPEATQLEYINISRNNFTDNLPASIGQLYYLTHLDVSSNNLSGVLPSSFANLNQLVYVNLAANGFEGPIFQHLRTCSNLRELLISQNKFKGQIPMVATGQWPALRTLDAGYNFLAGPLPATLVNIAGLKVLSLSSNELEGTIPANWSTWPSLEQLVLNSNKLSGIVPQQLAAMPQLRLFQVANNNLTTTPNFRAAAQRSQLKVDVRNNHICFGPLETNFIAPSQHLLNSFLYINQTMPIGEDVEVQSINEPLSVACSFSGTHNTYQWYKRINNGVANAQAGWPPNNNWQVVPGATANGTTSAELQINHPVAGDAGSYICAVKNGWVTSLTLYTRIVTIQLTGGVIADPLCAGTSDLNRTWLIERTYDGLGDTYEHIVAESKQFNDLLGRPTQTQTRNIANQHVFASQTIYNSYGKPVLTTLPAPINNSCFSYKEGFITTNSSSYNYTHFEGSNSAAPLPVDIATTPGTLGYYYSVNNQLEPATPATNYPFSLVDPFNDPVGGIKRSALPGDELHMGQGHESSMRTMPILNELTHYANARSQFIATSSGITYNRQGHKTISIDSEGKELITFTDKDGQTIATCLTGAQYPAMTLTGTVDANQAQGYPAYQDIHISSGTQQLSFSGGGMVGIVNLKTGASVGYVTVSSTTTNFPAPALAPGFYRLTPVYGQQSFTYDAHYGDFSYTYYNDAGLPFVVVAPKGINVATNSPLTHVSQTTYNTAGRELTKRSGDEGRIEFIYTADDRLRFSQTSRQYLAGTFSYVSYDHLNRVIESGEFEMGGGSTLVFESQSTAVPASNSVLQSSLLESRGRDQPQLPLGRRRQIVSAWYDTPFNDPELGGRQQDFVRGAVSKTQNEQVTSWYSYDEAGRVAWMVQKVVGLGTKTVEYKYDVSGKVQEVAYQPNQPDNFHHYYEYDANQRLRKTYTSPDGTVRTLQVKYGYYLHGALKRMEVANRLQGVDYTYTLGGALKSINHVNPRLDAGQDSPAANGVPKDLFGLTLDYYSGDYRSRSIPTVITPNLGARPTRYDGMVRDVAWRTASSSPWHQIAYNYDAKGQLTRSDYGTLALTGGAYQFTPSAISAYEEGDLQYDSNGNIMQLRRRDKLGTVVDNFGYDYNPNNNRLTGVHTPGIGNPLLLEYEYDASGQMIHQRDGQEHRYLTYDVRGKVTNVSAAPNLGQKVVTYTYDEKGYRCRKTTYSSTGAEKTFTYYVRDINGNILASYDQDLTNALPLQRSQVPLYGSNRLGSLTRLDDGSEDARYELNDQRGDARLIFHRPTTTITTQTMELNELQTEESFVNVDLYRYPFTTPTGEFIARLDGRGPMTPGSNQLTSVRRVEVGDTVVFTALGLLTNNFTTGPVRRPATWLRPALKLTAGTLAGAANTSVVGRPEQVTSATRSTFSNLLTRVTAGLSFTLGVNYTPNTETINNNGPGGPTGPLGPSQAWIAYYVNYDDGTTASGVEYVDRSALNNWQTVQLALRVTKPGQLQLSAGTAETSGFTYFDDLKVQVTGGMIVQEQHQYAYGAPMAGLNYTVGGKVYRHGYQGQFAEKDAETGWDSFEARTYDSRIGRWLSPDAIRRVGSAYAGMGNNPIAFGDADGKDVIVLNDTNGAHGTGHVALLVGSDAEGWRLFSKNGTDKFFGMMGPAPAKGHQASQWGWYYKTLEEFFEANAQICDGSQYDRAIYIETTQEEDCLVIAGAESCLKHNYGVLQSSCQTTVQKALKPLDIPVSGRAAIGSNFPNRNFNRLYDQLEERNRLALTNPAIKPREFQDYTPFVRGGIRSALVAAGVAIKAAKFINAALHVRVKNPRFR